jgi:acyl-CoA reductase-like NAD-dependent aldehyde dehydrogenase
LEHVALQERYQLFIGGRWKNSSDGGTFKSYCPANGELLAICAEATSGDVDEAVSAGWKAWDGWKKNTASERAAALNAAADVVAANIEHLAKVEMADTGKPLREALDGDMQSVIRQLRYFAAAIQTEEGVATMLSEDLLSLALREPIGVVGLIVPWNLPLALAANKFAPALAAGCCVVLKPSSHTSLSALEFARLAEGVFPPGVFNVVTGSGSRVGNYILEHKGLRKIAFTGSTEVGKTVAKAAGDRLIPTTLELGGKSANIYFPDCDWECALDGLMKGILMNQGEVCMAGSRVFVHEDIYDKFLEEAARRFDKIKVGMPWEKDTQMGAMIYESHMNSVLEYIEKGKKEGATVACGGGRILQNGLDKGFFLQPTILSNVRNDMIVAQEEIFGPVACFIKFKTEEEVIAMANDSRYGLAGAVWTKDISRAIRVARAIETGRVWINAYLKGGTGAPMGGCKESGIGRENNKMTLEHYMQVKNIIINLRDAPSGLYKVD